MSAPGEGEATDPSSSLGDWVWARWQWLVGGVLVLFVLNNLAGLVAGAVGLIAFANRVAGKLLAAARVAEEIRRTTSGD